MERFEAEPIEEVSAQPCARAADELNRLQLPWVIVTSGFSAGPLCPRACRPAPGAAGAHYRGTSAARKPQPDPYLLGAEKLGFRPAACIVVEVEDAIAGIQSGLAAGWPVIAVNPPPETPQKDVVGIIVASLRPLVVTREGITPW